MKNLLILIMPTILMFAIAACENANEENIVRADVASIETVSVCDENDYNEEAFGYIFVNHETESRA